MRQFYATVCQNRVGRMNLNLGFGRVGILTFVATSDVTWERNPSVAAHCSVGDSAWIKVAAKSLNFNRSLRKGFCKVCFGRALSGCLARSSGFKALRKFAPDAPFQAALLGAVLSLPLRGHDLSLTRASAWCTSARLGEGSPPNLRAGSLR